MLVEDILCLMADGYLEFLKVEGGEISKVGEVGCLQFAACEQAHILGIRNNTIDKNGIWRCYDTFQFGSAIAEEDELSLLQQVGISISVDNFCLNVGQTVKAAVE